MGSRPSSFRKGGGRLNGVNVTFVGYTFTDDQISFEAGGVMTREPFKPGKYKAKDGQLKERFHALNYIQTFRVEGATEDIEQPFFVGGADDWEISEDGLSLNPLKDDQSLGQNTAFAALIDSLCANGFSENNLPEDGEPINYEAINGIVARIIQVPDPAMKGKKRAGKNGKEYDYTLTVVDDVISLPEDAPAAKPAAKASAKAAPAKGGKKAAAPTAETLAAEWLIAITQQNGEVEEGVATLGIGQFSMAVLKNPDYAKSPSCGAVRKLLDPKSAFFTTENGWSYDAKAKTVSVPALELVDSE